MQEITRENPRFDIILESVVQDMIDRGISFNDGKETDTDLFKKEVVGISLDEEGYVKLRLKNHEGDDL